jgi:hypothetical protein
MAPGAAPEVLVSQPQGFQIPSLKELKKSPRTEPALEPEERGWPPFDTLEEEVPPRAPAEEAAPRPKPPAWVRFISPLFFVVLFLVTQFWLRDSGRPRRDLPGGSGASQPTLREGGFTGEIPEGRMVETRTVFSLENDRQIVFVSTWSGSPGGHSYSVEWYSPDGGAHSYSDVAPSAAPGGEGFLIIATMDLDASLSLGEWRAEVSQDEEIVSRYAFRLE